MPDLPPNPITPLRQLAAATKEFFDNMRAVGFSNQQSLFLTGEWLKGMAALAQNNQTNDG